MGWSIDAFYDVDQEEIENFIKDNNIDDSNIKLLIKHFYEKFSGEKLNENIESYYIPTCYSYNKDSELHVLYEYHQCNYVLKHKLLRNDDSPPKKVKLPFHLSCWNLCLRTSKDAIRIATDLREYFPEDEPLMGFAEKTSKYCYEYRISM